MISACFVVVSECRSCLYYTLLVSLVSPAPKWAADRCAGSKSKGSPNFWAKRALEWQPRSQRVGKGGQETKHMGHKD